MSAHLRKVQPMRPTKKSINDSWKRALRSSLDLDVLISALCSPIQAQMRQIALGNPLSSTNTVLSRVNHHNSTL